MNSKHYYFSSFNLKSNVGPTQEQADEYYKGTNVRVNVTKGIQQWIVPFTGRYIIKAGGASGQSTCLSCIGGNGAVVASYFSLYRNDKLFIIVGQQGTVPIDNEWGGSGGGGTFIAKEDHNSDDFLKPINANVKLLLIAAGGGGSGDANTVYQPKKGEPGLCVLVDEGGGNTGQYRSSGGGGYIHDSLSGLAKSFLNGGESGSSSGRGGNSYGGFGGGGTPFDGGGGGGGYRGGDSGSNGVRGYGGYSFYDNLTTISCISGENEGNGFVWISLDQIQLITKTDNYSYISILYLFIIL